MFEGCHSQSNGPERGVSIVGVLIAVGVLSFGIYTFMQSSSTSLKSLSRSEDITTRSLILRNLAKRIDCAYTLSNAPSCTSAQEKIDVFTRNESGVLRLFINQNGTVFNGMKVWATCFDTNKFNISSKRKNSAGETPALPPGISVCTDESASPSLEYAQSVTVAIGALADMGTISSTDPQCGESQTSFAADDFKLCFLSGQKRRRSYLSCTVEKTSANWLMNASTCLRTAGDQVECRFDCYK